MSEPVQTHHLSLKAREARQKLAASFASGQTLGHLPLCAFRHLVETGPPYHRWTESQLSAGSALLESAGETLEVSTEMLLGLLPALDAAARALLSQTDQLPAGISPYVPVPSKITQAYVPLTVPATPTMDALKVQAAKARLRLLALKK